MINLIGIKKGFAMKNSGKFLLIGFFLVCASTWAQDGLSELDDSVDNISVENETLNIAGSTHEKSEDVKKKSAADIMKIKREQLEKRNEEKMKIAMENQRIQAEMKRMEAVQKAFDEQLKKLNQK